MSNFFSDFRHTEELYLLSYFFLREVDGGEKRREAPWSSG